MRAACLLFTAARKVNPIADFTAGKRLLANSAGTTAGTTPDCIATFDLLLFDLRIFRPRFLAPQLPRLALRISQRGPFRYKQRRVIKFNFVKPLLIRSKTPNSTRICPRLQDPKKARRDGGPSLGSQPSLKDRGEPVRVQHQKSKYQRERDQVSQPHLTAPAAHGPASPWLNGESGKSYPDRSEATIL
jgi:hypothetical protein